MVMRKRPEITELAFDRKVEELSAFVADAVSPFKDRNKEEQKARIDRAGKVFFYFAKTYLPHYFETPPAIMHREIIDLADIKPAPEKGEAIITAAVAAPTGFGKSVVISFGHTIWELLFGHTNFTIIASETKSLAEDHVASIAAELIDNPRIRYDFRPRIGRLRDGDLIVKGGGRVYARGAGQQIRGVKHRSRRPDTIKLDDLESDKSAKNPERVKALLKWIKGTVLSRFGRTGRLFIIGTIVDPSSALAIILHSDEEPWVHWIRRLFTALRADGSSLWPEMYPVEVLEGMRRKMGEDAFQTEKMNNPRRPDAMFKPEWIRKYDSDDLRQVALAIATFYDPSVGHGESNDFKAIITVGLDMAAMIYYVLDALVQKISLDSASLAVVDKTRTFDPLVVGVEDNVFQKLLLMELASIAREQKLTLPLRGVTHSLGKETRLSGMSPLIERGQVRFNPKQGDQKILIEQLLRFPSSMVNDDGPDALEGAISLLKPLGNEVAYESVEKRRAAGFGAGAW